MRGDRPAGSVAVAVDLDAFARLLVDALVLAPGILAVRRLVGDLQHAVAVVPAIEHGPRILGVGRGGLFGALALGLRLLGRAWFNLDLLWGVALILTGAATALA